MFDALHTIIGPNPDSWPFPKHDWTMKEILIAAVLYLTVLILTRGVAAGTAFAMEAKSTTSAKMCCGRPQRSNHARSGDDSTGPCDTENVNGKDL